MTARVTPPLGAPARWSATAAAAGYACQCAGECRRAHPGGVCRARHGGYEHRRFGEGRTVVLVVAGRSDPTDPRATDLVARCQRCHDRTVAAVTAARSAIGSAQDGGRLW